MIYMLLIGLIIGAVAKLLMPGKDPGGFIVTMILGVLGSYLAYFIGYQTGMYSEGAPAGFVASVLGAVVILVAYRMFSGKNQHLPRY